MWFYIGIALLIWVIYDLFAGKVWSYREIDRSEEPAQYWLWMAVWLALAVSSIWMSGVI